VTNLYGLSFASLDYANQKEVMAFISARIEKMIGSKVPKDIREAVLESDTYIVSLILEASQALVQKSKDAQYKVSVESLSRAFNLAEKVTHSVSVDSSLFENNQEKALYQAILSLELTEDMHDNLDKLFALSPIINDFFDNTMVMTDDEKMKQNRLA
ncbi:DALR anticodon-binding domain-containing protein, partial [Streptococcus suis]